MTLSLIDKAKLLLHIAQWRLTWDKRNIHFRDASLPTERFITAWEAANMIPDGAVVMSCGMAGNARCSIFYWAIRERFEKQQHPKNLTWVKVGAQGSRGRAPGTLEELDFPGLITMLMGGHVETEKALLRLADQGHMEVHTMAQGAQTFVLEAQAEGRESVDTEVGLGSFLDPRVGNGSAVSPNAKHQFIEAVGDKLRYRMPKIEIGLFNASYADREGNVYFRNMSTITESIEMAKAAHANGGKVFVSVSDIIEKSPKEIGIEAKYIDHVIVNPDNEQTGSVKQRKYWPMFTPGSNVNTEQAVAKLKFAIDTLKITPQRGPVDNALARLGASLFVRETKPGAIVNIGVGLPEEVSRLLYTSGLYKDITFTTETGVFGGLPSPGIFFGASINPIKLESSAWMFHLYETKLDVSILGLLQVDSDGNVNVSKRGPRVLDYVGPGGFPDIVAGAKTILFVGSWMANAKMAIRDGKMVIEKPGKPKFVDKVDEITFSGKEGLRRGKKVYYITNVGVFRLVPEGLELIEVMPGLDIQRDIIGSSGARIKLADSGVKVVDRGVLTGEDFRLRWGG